MRKTEFMDICISLYEEKRITLDKCAELLGVSIEECKRILKKRGIKVE